MATTMWFLGAYPSLPASTVTVTGPGTIPAGNYYLWDSTASQSLVDALEAALVEAGAAGASVTLTKSGHVRIDLGTTGSITWSDATVRNLYGFTGNLSGSQVYVAPNRSPLFWSPGRTEIIPEGSLGSQGARNYDTEISDAPGYVVAVTQNVWRTATFQFGFIPTDRFSTKNELNGEYTTFFHEVLRNGRPFKAYRTIDEDEDDTTNPVTIPVDEVLGPYSWRPDRRVVFPYERESALRYVDAAHPVSIACQSFAGFVS